jgi:hypothetical protein
MFEQGLDLAMSRPIDQREMGRDDAQPGARMADLGGQGASAFYA